MLTLVATCDAAMFRSLTIDRHTQTLPVRPCAWGRMNNSPYAVRRPICPMWTLKGSPVNYRSDDRR
jgi:hypothetical protein